jgi:hypothetical protein
MGSVEVSKGRWVPLTEGSLEEWATDPRLLVPVVIHHNPGRLVGWCDKVKFNQSKALLFGDLDPGMPEARAVGNLVRAHRMDGLSPRVKARTGEVFYKAVGRWGKGDVVDLPELSVVWEPRIREARWLGV